MGFLFENMRVYQKSVEFTEGILDLLVHAPRGNATISEQLRRASMSVPTNLAEGLGRWHKGDRKQFFWIARGSVNECVVYLLFAVNRGVIKAADYPHLKSELDIIAKMITALIASQ